ncbi:hypothetical protein [Lentibacillus sp. Marseille-P4043]|uniref:hypothetical protein n=1 Tax=Lentibacillus sp. Marseille-P4043 TaxID=2040293 RepID=UPI000D0B4C5D|nr:hypothetical protein [Lentibacillus sp. Marseille-P4043]
MSDQLRKQLKKWSKSSNSSPDKKKRHEKQTERLSHEDLEELMGVNRRTYKRTRGGAFKQK